MPNSTRRNKETSLLFSEDPPSLERLIRKEKRFASIDNITSSSTDIHIPQSTETPILQEENGNLHDLEGHLRNAAVAKHEKLQEGDFEVESSMSFGSSHWCRSTPDYEHRPTDFNEHRSTSLPKNRLTTPAESVASCNAVRIMTHE
ncbi:hypothetical protein DY000_02015971 [Brassica cretica]|uniref:Uncharacterized protein n=1 Tax=Brassica cretica TaxID=69181 RepID=A0ABQ7CNN4_BRACR|nr:hypothetical protein DY000_02015971 [Brassica cretica]